MEYYSAVLLFTFSTSIAPGPNNIMLMTSGLNYGVRKTIPHFLGICIGFPLMVAAIGFGLGSIFKEYPFFHLVLKVLGITYLLHLAWKIARGGSSDTGKRLKKPLTFLQTVAFQWVNPKAWVITVGAMAAYTNSDGEIYVQIIFIIMAYFFAHILSMSLWLLFGASMQKLIRTQKQLSRFNISMALFLVASIIPMATSDFN